MSKFRVRLYTLTPRYFEVDADNEDEAVARVRARFESGDEGDFVDYESIRIHDYDIEEAEED